MNKLLLPAVLSLALLVPATASARVTSISVTSDRDLGTFANKPYRQAALQVQGVAPAGRYSVPAVLAYPARAADANGFALVEPYNTVGFWFADPLVPETPLPHLRDFVLGEEYLLGRGNVYIAVLWDKKLVEDTGQGYMAAGTDGYQVLRDTAALVRSPRSIPYPRGFTPPPAARKVVAGGYSGSTNLLRDFYLHHHNSRGRLAFDGALFAGSSGQCVGPADPAAFYACGGVVSDGGKVLVVNTEADVEFAGFAERGRRNDYRVQELAGVAHIPPSIFDWRQPDKKPDQNPISGSPAFRAAHANLLQWIKGGPPPDSRYIELQDVPPADLGGFPIRPGNTRRRRQRDRRHPPPAHDVPVARQAHRRAARFVHRTRPQHAKRVLLPRGQFRPVLTGAACRAVSDARGIRRSRHARRRPAARTAAHPAGRQGRLHRGGPLTAEPRSAR